MKISVLAILCLFLFGITACLKDDSRPYETTVTVVDVDGKPIKDRQVSIFVNTQPFSGGLFGAHQPFASSTTDANGKVVLQYKLNLTEDVQQFATAIALDDELFKGTNVVTQRAFTNNGVVTTNSGTIVMDSLTSFTMRFKTDRTDIQGLFVTVSTEFTSFTSSGTTTIHRNFLSSFAQTRTPKLDTIVTTKVYAKAPFIVNSSLSLLTTPFSIGKPTVKFVKNQDRSGVLLQTF